MVQNLNLSELDALILAESLTQRLGLNFSVTE